MNENVSLGRDAGIQVDSTSMRLSVMKAGPTGTYGICGNLSTCASHLTRTNNARDLEREALRQTGGERAKKEEGPVSSRVAGPRSAKP